MEDKLTINQVSEILQIEASTIRFWEKEFSSFLNIRAKKGQHKKYTEEHLKTFNQIKELLYTEQYTIKGAKRRLEMEKVLTGSLGLNNEFEAALFFMFSTILHELRSHREEIRELAGEVKKFQTQYNGVSEEENQEEQNKGLINFFRDKMNVRKVSK